MHATLAAAIESNRARHNPGTVHAVFVVCREHVVIHVHADEKTALAVHANSREMMDLHPGEILALTICRVPAWYTREQIARLVGGNHGLTILFA